jgi:ABC-2 type transport system ATP-binding protein
MNQRSPSRDAIRADGLTRIYGDHTPALLETSFTVGAGEIFGYLGPNGAGKSTTIKILTTLAKPDCGTAEIMGIDVVQDPQAVRRIIGVVAQRSGSDPAATGRENLTLQGQLHNLNPRSLDRRVSELLDRFELTDAADRLVKTYSGGMSRKLDIAMGLIHQPAVLFLDEPTTGLDPESRRQMWRDIASLARDEGVTIFLTTHYLEEADHLADRVAIIDRGQIVVEGSPDQLKSEFDGDAIHVEMMTEASANAAQEVLSSIDGFGDIQVEDRTLHARVHNGRSSIPTIFSALDSADLSVAAVTLSRPSLDDVYLRYAGRSYQAGSAVQAEQEES